jgi:5-formyltetrahydrofolate cyclo-ligase
MPSGEISTAEIVKHGFEEHKNIFIPYTYKQSTAREFWPHSIMDMVQLESIEDYHSLKPGRWGIPSPDRESINDRRNCFGGLGKSDDDIVEEHAENGLDIVIMPGLAFDRHLERLGHGKGYYDFFLQRYLWYTQKAHLKMPFLGKQACSSNCNVPHIRTNSLLSVALALNEQVLSPEEHVPSDTTDYKLDALIMGNGEVVRADHPSSRTNDVE